MTPRTTRTRTTLLALAIAAIVVPAALARPIPIPDDGDIAPPTSAVTAIPAKPMLEATTPGMKVTQSLYLSALAGTATTSR